MTCRAANSLHRTEGSKKSEGSREVRPSRFERVETLKLYGKNKGEDIPNAEIRKDCKFWANRWLLEQNKDMRALASRCDRVTLTRRFVSAVTLALSRTRLDNLNASTSVGELFTADPRARTARIPPPLYILYY